MPTSNVMFKKETADYISNKFKKRDIIILDVGPGVGAYSDLLRFVYPNIDCCEIYEPYIDRHNLRFKYKNVFISDICDLEFDYYDLIIMGDVLEHIEYNKATDLICRMFNKCEELIVCVPYNLPAGSYGGNDYEAHLQDDLNEKTMKERYPMLKMILSQPVYGHGMHNCGVFVKNNDVIIPDNIDILSKD